ncbi:MAG: helix-turn-helix domain-containing protein [Pseudorhodoplanes sp.]|nr:helix-turn-helix domain-containing protein [Pseudorhodoplanes sp.]
MKKPKKIRAKRAKRFGSKRAAKSSAAAASGLASRKQTRPMRRPRVRLDPAAREKMILDAAVLFFAEHGFEAQLSDLVERLGVSQGLIFRYFENKQALIERVYEQVYIARWLPDWERILQNRSQSMEIRLIDFYRSYLAAVDDYFWVRTALYSGLSGNDLTRRYILTRVEHLLSIIGDELMAAARNVTPQSRAHLHEITWHLHSTFIYYLIRKYVYNVPVSDDRDGFVEAVVRQFMAGFRTSD